MVVESVAAGVPFGLDGTYGAAEVKQVISAAERSDKVFSNIVGQCHTEARKVLQLLLVKRLSIYNRARTGQSLPAVDKHGWSQLT